MYKGQQLNTKSSLEKKEAWWKNAKEVFKKPWKRNQSPREESGVFKSSAQLERAPPLPIFLPFERSRSNSTPQQELSQQLHGRETEEANEFEFPDCGNPTRRPRLDSVFPLQNTSVPKENATKPKRKTAVVYPIAFSVKKIEEMEEKESENGDDKSKEEDGGRHRSREYEIEPDTDKRKISTSSDVSNDRSIDRKLRRESAVRKLPRLPHRSSFDQSDTRSYYSLPEGRIATSFHHYTKPARRETVAVSPFYATELMVPPRYYTPCEPRPDYLPTVSEENDDEIKGFDHFMLY